MQRIEMKILKLFTNQMKNISIIWWLMCLIKIQTNSLFKNIMICKKLNFLWKKSYIFLYSYFRLHHAIEFGLYAKWVRELQGFGSKFFEDSDKKLPKVNYKPANHVVKIKPALGPFFVGVFTSIIVFVFEILILKKFLKPRTNANKLFMKTRRNTF